ncbi:hypothetical protein E4T56_gene9556 [Termitomyces sp. T112]|nr:hypothetical protein E4T56_gene9556 [Termitomyces sp. T112]KNZ74137.1 hypothetical protein J132_07784 [Termitomyces sp. J132]
MFTFGFSFLALRPTASSVPIVLTLTTLLVYGHRQFRSQHAFKDATMLITAITFAGVLARASPSVNALSSVGVSVIVLFILALITSTLTISIVYINTRLGSHFPGAWSRLTFFPALWATLWFGVSYISPVGRLSAWSPTEGGSFYGWMAPFFGPVGNDWVVAAWAVVLAQAIGAWYIGEGIPQIATTAPATFQTSHLSSRNSSLLLTVILLVLGIPSLLLSNFPLAVVAGPDITPLSMGCVLPPYRRYKHHTLTLDDYIEESKKLTSSARFLLWPEGAVTFKSETDLAEGLAQVQDNVTGSVVGVSFEEDFGDPTSGASGSRRTGIALVSQAPTSPELVYYKRHLVPIAESFSLSHSQLPPNVTTFHLTAPKDMKKIDWVPDGPPYTRPISVTASICLDFAFPSLFAELQSKPALILAPARTWDIAVGHAMWQQVSQRAEELGTMILWCDGGDGGVSGIAGGGFKDFIQVGLGSWVKTVGISYPFNERRTVNHWGGDLACLILVWLSVFGTKFLGRIHFDVFRLDVHKLRNIFRKPPVPEGNLI